MAKLFKTSSREPHFKSLEQRQMVCKALDAVTATTDVLFVLATGAGKSIAFAAAAMFERNYHQRKTIVICPLRSLCKDLQSRMISLGLLAEVSQI